jgi:hypothetical protein
MPIWKYHNETFAQLTYAIIKKGKELSHAFDV